MTCRSFEGSAQKYLGQEKIMAGTASLFVDKRAVNRKPHVVFHISYGFILHEAPSNQELDIIINSFSLVMSNTY